MDQLNNKIAIITGASSGIGKAIALAFAAEGATAVLASRNKKKLDEVAKQIADTGGTACVIPTDVTDEDQVMRLFQETSRQFDRIDLLVNNAGTATAASLAHAPALVHQTKQLNRDLAL